MPTDIRISLRPEQQNNDESRAKSYLSQSTTSTSYNDDLAVKS
jgi:hypothetical protein